jgi:hypothetical protein
MNIHDASSPADVAAIRRDMLLAADALREIRQDLEGFLAALVAQDAQRAAELYAALRSTAGIAHRAVARSALEAFEDIYQESNGALLPIPLERLPWLHEQKGLT